MLLEQRNRMAVLGLGCLRLVDARQVRFEPGKILVPNVRTEGGDAPVGRRQQSGSDQGIGRCGLHVEVSLGLIQFFEFR